MAEYSVVTGVGTGGVTALQKALYEQQDNLPARPCKPCRPAAGALQRGRPPRSANTCVAPSRRDELTARHNTGHRSDHCVRNISGGAGCVAVPIQTAVRSIARAYPRKRTASAVWRGWAGSPNRVTAICDDCSWSAQRRSCAWRASMPLANIGWPSFSSANRRRSRRSRSSTRQRASLGQ